MMNTTCDVCGPLGAGYTASTGYGKSFPDAYDRLVKLDLSLHCDLLRCPKCAALFFWEDRPQFFGSGNLDEEDLTRLSEDDAAMVRKLLELPDDPVIAPILVNSAFVILNNEMVDALLMHLCYKRPSEFRHILSALLDRLYEQNTSSTHSLLASYCFSKADRARVILDLVAADPRKPSLGIEWLCKSVAKEIPRAG